MGPLGRCGALLVRSDPTDPWSGRRRATRPADSQWVEGAELSNDRPLTAGPDESNATPRGPAGWASPRSARWDDSSTEGGQAEQAELAHWGLRVASYVVDFVVPFVAAGIVVRVWGPAGVVAYVMAVGFVIWNLVRQGARGQTVGKGFVGTKLVRLDNGEVVGPWLSIGRYIGHIVDALPLYLGFLWPLWDDRRQTFSDKMCRTVVIVI